MDAHLALGPYKDEGRFLEELGSEGPLIGSNLPRFATLIALKTVFNNAR